jgi:hypothetical protein
MDKILNQISNQTSPVGNVPIVYIEQDLWTLVLCGFVICAALLCIVIVAWFIKKFLTPQESTNIYKSSRKKQALMLLLHMDHWGDIIPVHKFIPEGILESDTEGKGHLKTSSVFAVPQNTVVPLPKVSLEKSAEATQQVTQWLADMNNEKVILRGARVPIFGAVADKAIAVGLKGFAALALLNKFERLFNVISPVAEQNVDGEKKQEKDLLKELKKHSEFKELADVLKEFKNQFSLIDLNNVRGYFPYFYDQTHRDSMKERNQLIGFRKALKKNDKSDVKTVMLLMITVLGLAVVLIAAVYFFTNGGA